MVEVGLSETGGGITGALCKAASRVVPDPMSRLHHISAMHRLAARRCSGIFPQLFPRKTGSLATETPRLPGRSAVCLPPDCRRGPHSSQSGQCFPKPNKAAQASHSCSHAAASSRGDCCVTNSRTGTSGSSATSSSAWRPCPTNARQGRGLVVAVLVWQGFAALSLANDQNSAFSPELRRNRII